jgi:hypothetical protein
MPFNKKLCTSEWSKQAKTWANQQIGDFSEAVQKEIVEKLTEKLKDFIFWVRLEQAFSLRLPGPEVGYDKLNEYAGQIANSTWIVLFRYYSDDPIAMMPRLFTAASNLPSIGRNTQENSLYSLVGFFREAGVEASSLSELYKAVEYVMKVSRQEPSYSPSPEKPPKTYAAARRVMYHQTGGDKPDDPYLSTSCVLPCLNRSTCSTVVEIRRCANYLGFFLVPCSKVRILWLPEQGYLSLFDTKITLTYNPHSNTQDIERRHRMETSWNKMLDEREVAYVFPPPLDMWEVCRIDNPLKGTGTV